MVPDPGGSEGMALPKCLQSRSMSWGPLSGCASQAILRCLLQKLTSRSDERFDIYDSEDSCDNSSTAQLLDNLRANVELFECKFEGLLPKAERVDQGSQTEDVRYCLHGDPESLQLED